MPIATPEIYAEMIDRAKAGGFAFPAVNVTSSQTLNAALRGFAEAESDGIVQVSTGGAAYWSGASPKDMLDGFVLPLLAASEAEVKAGRNPLFNSHMWDGSAETLQENLRIARELLARTAAAKMILEVEIGTVGGEADAVSYGVIKMNIDTDTQYAYTRPVADHMFRNYDGVLKVDGEVGNKKQYDPRVWGAAAEAGLAARVVEAAQQLGSTGKTF